MPALLPVQRPDGATDARPSSPGSAGSRDQLGRARVLGRMTTPLTRRLPIVALLLPLLLSSACDAPDDDAAEFDALAADLADHVGIEDYQIVVLQSEVVPEDEEPSDEPPNASFPGELTADDDPMMACRLTGWIGHTQVCQVCTVDWIYWGCVESVDCLDGGPTTYRVCTGPATR